MNVNKLKAMMALKGVKVTKIVEVLGIEKCTFYRKLRRNGDFSREEIKQMIDLLNLNEGEAMDIFFNEEVS